MWVRRLPVKTWWRSKSWKIPFMHPICFCKSWLSSAKECRSFAAISPNYYQLNTHFLIPIAISSFLRRIKLQHSSFSLHKFESNTLQQCLNQFLVKHNRWDVSAILHSPNWGIQISDTWNPYFTLKPKSKLRNKNFWTPLDLHLVSLIMRKIQGTK